MRVLQSNCTSTRLGQLPNGFQRIDFIGRFVRPQTNDTRKPQSKTTLVAIGWLNSIKSYFDDDAWLNHPHAAMGKLLNGVPSKPFSHLRDFRVRQPRVGFANIE